MLTESAIKVFKACATGTDSCYITRINGVSDSYKTSYIKLHTSSIPTGNGDIVDQRSNVQTSIGIGRGNSEPKRSSIKLDDLIQYEVTRKGGYVSWNYDNTDMDVSYYSVTNIFANSSSSSITIKEIGLFTTFLSTAYMIDRKVLENPVVLGPGEEIAFTYTINM